MNIYNNDWFIGCFFILILSFSVNSIGLAENQNAAETVAALDTEYQAAVAKNDADTMARILADDFVLVTGNGTVYTKEDLLKEARAKNNRLSLWPFL